MIRPGCSVPLGIVPRRPAMSGATVSISGGLNVNSVTFVDLSNLSVNVPAKKGGSAKGTYDLTVTNPDGGSASATVNQ